MNKKALNVLEYGKIKELLSDKAGSELTRDKIRALEPFAQPVLIKENLALTTEGVSLILAKGSLPTGGVYDIGGIVKRTEKGGSLTPRQLLKVHFNLRIASQTKGWLNDGDLPELPLIREMTGLIVTLPALEREIDNAIESEDEIADSASSELRNIRRKKLSKEGEIRNKLDRMVNARGNQLYLQDSVVTMRDGRYVIPVKQEHRSKFPGLIHDQSKGGATVFIEPQAVVNLNNDLRELELDEEKEIERILAELSAGVATYNYDIINNQKLLVELDFVMAKSRLSIDMEGSEPEINEEGVLRILKGRHPLLDSKTAVPLDVELDQNRTLVITGPNTGGKTVTLKTAGLLSMMVQSGLHVPASALSNFPVFTDIFADIGDEQSIEQSLSTFSSHMKNIVNILDGASFDTLVLLDELGAGTDPTEGAALAIAILEDLRKKGAMIFATTHYNEIKKYGIATDGVINGAMEFDTDTLSPTYRLLTGVIGKSNAFDISAKLGLDRGIIDYASGLIDRGDMEFEDLVGTIEEDRRIARNQREEIERMSSEMKAQQVKFDAEREKLEAEREKILSEAKNEAKDIIREARETSDIVKDELKDLAREESLGTRNRRFADAKSLLNEADRKYSGRTIKKVNSKPVDASAIKVGDRVKVITLDQSGTVLTLPDSDGNLQVQVGIMKVSVNVKDLMLTEQKKKKKPKEKFGKIYKKKAMNISPEIDVRGLYTDEALMEVSKYIDDASIAGLEKVTVIHGRGTGALQKAIRSNLKKNKQVKSFEAGSYNAGGQGVTVVKLK